MNTTLPPDPITIAYQAVLASLLNWGGFKSLITLPNGQVAMWNVNDFTDKRFAAQGIKEGIQAGDTPEVTLLMRKMYPNPNGLNSRTADFIQDFPLVMVNPNMMQVNYLNQLTWQATIALVKAGDFSSVLWSGNQFIRDWSVTDGIVDVPAFSAPTPPARQSPREVSVLTVRMNMYFDRAALYRMTYP